MLGQQTAAVLGCASSECVSVSAVSVMRVVCVRVRTGWPGLGVLVVFVAGALCHHTCQLHIPRLQFLREQTPHEELNVLDQVWQDFKVNVALQLHSSQKCLYGSFVCKIS